QQLLNNEVLEFSTTPWLTEENRILLTWMKDELYAFLPPKIGFTSWIFIEKETMQVIGDGGYKGNPNEKGEIELGYEIISSKRQQGYATEAMQALLQWTLNQHEVKVITAKCHYENMPSQTLLDNLGFTHVGEEDEMDLYEIKLESNPITAFFNKLTSKFNKKK
ncbi:MAG TPA: N-acetyltransferase, partial [Firmicutes bacterium]|nr:N-acetyltransferase [Bacillota bacterium]